MPFLPVGLETASEAPGWAQTGAVPRLPEVSATSPPPSLHSYLCFTLTHLCCFGCY